MNKRQQATLKNIFRKPTLATIKYSAVESLILALGGEVEKGRSGSRVAFILNDQTIIVHKPHPQNELHKYAVEDIRDFLIQAGEGQ
jgi:hypothetical protein